MSEFDPGGAPSIASMTDKVRPLPLGMAVASAHFLGDTAVSSAPRRSRFRQR